MFDFADMKSAVELVAQANQLAADLQSSSARAKAAAELATATWVAGHRRLRAAEFIALAEAAERGV